jgi:hypothetical protein
MIPPASMTAGRLRRHFVCLSDIGAQRREAATQFGEMHMSRSPN